MLTITPCLDTQTVAACCKQHGKLYSNAFYLYVAEHGGMREASALFEVERDHVVVVCYEALDSSDAFLFDGILRAGLNYAAEQGIENGLLPEPFRYAHRALFAKLNFPIQPMFNITNFFQKYKNCAQGSP